MKRSVQEVLELVVIGLVALIVGMLLLWGAGWVFTFLGWLLRLVGSFIWLLLRFIIPIAIVAGIVYLIVRLVTNQQKKSNAKTTYSPTVSGPATSPSVPVTPSVAPERITTPPPAPTVRVDPDIAARPASSYDADTFETGAASATQTPPPVTQDTPGSERVVETRADDAEPVDYDVDTSGFKKMDDLAEDLASNDEDEDTKS